VDLVSLAEESLGALAANLSPEPVPAEYVGGEARVRSTSGQRIAIGLKGQKRGGRDAAAAAVFAEVLGSGARRTARCVGLSGGSSRLGRLFAGNDQAAKMKSASAAHLPYSDSGLLSVVAEVVEGAAGEAFELLAAEVKAAAAPSAEEVASAKGRVKASVLAQIDCNATFALTLATEGGNAADIVAAIDAVEVRDVARFASDAMKAPPSFACVGDLSAPRYNKLVKLFA
jgi:predicted Zn-dependent peptidase